MSSSNIVMGYSPGDFFYADATNRGLMLSDQSCNALKPNDSTWDTRCADPNLFPDLSMNCINRELCLNSNKVHWLMENENASPGTDKKNTDIKVNYDKAIVDIFNLGIGLAFLIFLLYKKYQQRNK